MLIAQAKASTSAGEDRTFSLGPLGQAPRSHGAGALSDRLVPYRPVQYTSRHADSLDHLRRRYTVLVHVANPVVDVVQLDPSDRHGAEPRLDSQPPGRRIIDLSGGLPLLGRKCLWRLGETMGLRVEVAKFGNGPDGNRRTDPQPRLPRVTRVLTERCQPLSLVVCGACLATHQWEIYESPRQPP